MDKELIVLSLFDGHSGAQISLKEQGIKVKKYYASEVDKHAIKQTQHVFPNTIQLGDVRDVDVSKLDKIDILFGGSPCTDLSFAGKQSGLICDTFEQYMELREEYLRTMDEDLYFYNGKFQQSILFWEYLRILKEIREINPNVKFLLENVGMTKKNQLKFNQNMGLAPAIINSNLVSAQNRHRLYWTNIRTKQEGLFGDLVSDIPQPKNRGIFLKDILQPEDEIDEKYYLSTKMINAINKVNYSKPKINPEKTGTLNTKNNSPQWSFDSGTTIVKIDKHGNTNGKGGYFHEDNGNGIIGHSGSGGQKGHIYHDNCKMGSLCATDYKQPKQICVTKNYLQWNPDGNNNNSQANRAYYEDSKVPSLGAGHAMSQPNIVRPGCIKFGRSEEGKKARRESMKKGKDHTPFQAKEIVGIDFEKMNTITCATTKDNLLIVPEATSKGFAEIKPGECVDLENPNSKTRRGRKMDDKSNCLMEQQNAFAKFTEDFRLRRLTPIECARLQTVPEWYDWSVSSDTQTYRMLGNGWTIEVIKHILSFLP